MSKNREDMIKELDAKIPRDVVKERDGGSGRSFSYLEGQYVIARMNEIFGQGNWAYITEEAKCVHEGEHNGKYTCHYIARVRVEVPALGHALFVDYGYGDGMDKVNPGKAHELAVKEAVTDGFKRAAKNLGMSMGLALYSKDQENVDDGEPEVQKAAVAQGPARTPRSDTVGPSAGESKKADSQEPANAIPKEPPKGRQELNTMLTQMAGVVAAKRKMSISQIKTEIKTRYKVDNKEALSDEQAADFYKFLRGKIYE